MSDEHFASRNCDPTTERTPPERLEVKVLGRILGYCTGWEDIDTEIFCFLDFEPNPGVDLAPGNLTVDYGNGQFQYHNREGEIVDTRDIIPIVERLPRS